MRSRCALPALLLFACAKPPPTPPSGTAAPPARVSASAARAQERIPTPEDYAAEARRKIDTTNLERVLAELDAELAETSSGRSAPSVPSSPAPARESTLPACPCPGVGHALAALPLERGTRYVSRVRYDDAARDWLPEPCPRVLDHHAARIEWRGLERFGSLEPGLSLEFSGVARDHRVWQVSPGQWRSISEVEVTCVCAR